MSREPYRGASRKLLIAFDIGTTYSGISYCLLDPGEIPRTVNVTRFPGQEHSTGSAKIPSVMYYDQEESMRAAGAECDLGDNIFSAEMQDWTKVEWFKLRLKPKAMPLALQQTPLPPLPPNRSLLNVFADFIGYLLHCTKLFFEEDGAGKAAQWITLIRSAEFIFGHPNGWEGAQQARLRQAAIRARLIPDTMADRARVHFVTEGEASLHFCLFERLVDEGTVMSDKGFLIADLGGGTLDFSTYKLLSADPIQVEEISPTICQLEGSALVKMRFTAYIADVLATSRYGSEGHVAHIAERFDQTTKRQFRSPNQSSLVSFGTIEDRDFQVNITNGRLPISGANMAELFEPSVEAACNAILNCVMPAKFPIRSVYLVGGFSASPYMVTELRNRLANASITVSVPDGQTSKAVADGAISYFIDHYVKSRVAKMTYGTKVHRTYNHRDPEHYKRRTHVYQLLSGDSVLGDSFSTVLEKGISTNETKEFTKCYSREKRSRDSISSSSTRIYAYIGPGEPPQFMNGLPNSVNFKLLCTIVADMSGLSNILQERTGPSGVKYWKYKYHIVVRFGLTEIKAHVTWKENGVEKRSDAEVIYDELIEDMRDDDPEGDLAKMFKGAHIANPEADAVPGQAEEEPLSFNPWLQRARSMAGNSSSNLPTYERAVAIRPPPQWR